MKIISNQALQHISGGEIDHGTALCMIGSCAVLGVASAYQLSSEGYEIPYLLAGYIAGTMVGIFSTCLTI